MVEHLKKIYANMKLSRKIMLVFLVLLFIFLCMFMIMITVITKIYDKKLYENSMQELDFFTQNVNESLDDVEACSYYLVLDKGNQQLLKDLSEIRNPSWDYLKQLEEVKSALWDGLNSYDTVKNVTFQDIHEVNYQIGISTGEIPFDIYNSLIQQIHDAKGAFTMMAPTKEYPYLMGGREILYRLDMSLNYLGTVVLTCDIKDIIEENEDKMESPHEALFVYDGDTMIYQDTENVPKLPAVYKDQGYQIIRYQKQEYFLCYLKSQKTGWIYVNIFPYSQIYGQLLFIRYFILGGCVVVFILIIYLANRLSNIITRPLNQLTESMQIVEKGDFKKAKLVFEEENRQDEVGLLTQEFQVMLDKIDFLIYENYEKQILLKDTKYKMLQAQINPHFLYNTLNALNWMVKAGRTEDAGKMIVELGQLLRASFAADAYATVEDEIQMVKSYIVIQKFRYQKRAEFVVEEEGNLSNYIMPRMVLQPLVENAINYGVDNSINTCFITVNVMEEDTTLFLSVEDTGPGMTNEQLEKVRNFTVEAKGHGIGLKNIYERLNITYGDFEFHVDSQLGSGTKIQIRIPKKKGEARNV